MQFAEHLEDAGDLAPREPLGPGRATRARETR